MDERSTAQSRVCLCECLCVCVYVRAPVAVVVVAVVVVGVVAVAVVVIVVASTFRVVLVRSGRQFDDFMARNNSCPAKVVTLSGDDYDFHRVNKTDERVEDQNELLFSLSSLSLLLADKLMLAKPIPRPRNTPMTGWCLLAVRDVVALRLGCG